MLWRQCVSCCRHDSEDDDDTKLCQLTLTLNCCAHHNATYTVTDGADEAETAAEPLEGNKSRCGIAKDLLQHTSSSSLRQRSKSRESVRLE